MNARCPINYCKPSFTRRSILRPFRNSDKSGNCSVGWPLSGDRRTFDVNCMTRLRRVVTHVVINPTGLSL